MSTMLTTLLKAVDSNKLSDFVGDRTGKGVLDLCPLDIDVLVDEALENGEIEIDKEKNEIKRLKEPESSYYNEKLLNQIKKLIRSYDKDGLNITSSRIQLKALDSTGRGYLTHDIICTLYYLDECGEVNMYEINVPKKKNRPAHTFKFYTYLDHQEFGAKAVNDFISKFDTI